MTDGHASTSAADQRADHLLDPRSGRPARGVLSATVVAHSGIEADALSTAVFVLGPEAGLALLQRRGAEGIMLLREDGRAVGEHVAALHEHEGERAHGAQPSTAEAVTQEPPRGETFWGLFQVRWQLAM